LKEGIKDKKMEITTREAINKGYNMLVTGLLSFVGIGLIGEFFNEVEWRDKADDIAIVILAIIGVSWYFTGRNRHKSSWFPFILLLITTLIKASTLIFEFNDQVARGDEFGLVLPLIVLTIISGISVYRNHRDNQLSATMHAPEKMSPGD
jgi:FtsH-binding integral membrane protein